MILTHPFNERSWRSLQLGTLETCLLMYSFSTSTWIEKLGQLGIRKNVLAEEWRKLYRHSLPRLEDPSRKKGDLKLKRTKKKTEVIVRGRIYNWDQAWKNMKSSNAIGQVPRPDGT